MKTVTTKSKLVLDLSDNCFDQKIMVYFGDYNFMRKDLARRFKLDLKMDPDDELVKGFCQYVWSEKAQTMVFTVYIREFNPSKTEDYDTIIHETFHLTMFIMGFIDVKIKTKEHEPAAYFIGWVNKKIIEFLHREKK